MAVGRELAKTLVEFRMEKRKRLQLVSALKRQHPDIRFVFRIFLRKDDKPAIARPLSGPPAGSGWEHRLLPARPTGLFLIKTHGPSAAGRGEHNPVALGRPVRKGVERW